MGWQDTERGHTGMAGVGTEVGGGKEGAVGGSVAARGFMEGESTNRSTAGESGGEKRAGQNRK